MQKKTTFMNLLARCLNWMIKQGYTAKFAMTNKGLFLPRNGKYYGPYEAMVITKFCFENSNGKEGSSAIYMIETTDGIKGTWVDGVAGTKLNKHLWEKFTR